MLFVRGRTKDFDILKDSLIISQILYSVRLHLGWYSGLATLENILRPAHPLIISTIIGNKGKMRLSHREILWSSVSSKPFYSMSEQMRLMDFEIPRL